MSTSANIIQYGGAVVGDPTANPVDALLAAAAVPSITPGQITLQPVDSIYPVNVPDTTPAVQPNVVSIAAPQSQQSVLPWLGVAAVAAVLFSGSGKSVGKKKENNLVALLALGAGAYWLYTKNQKENPVSVAPVAQTPTGGTDTVQPMPGGVMTSDPTQTTAPGPLGTGGSGSGYSPIPIK